MLISVDMVHDLTFFKFTPEHFLYHYSMLMPTIFFNISYGTCSTEFNFVRSSGFPGAALEFRR